MIKSSGTFYKTLERNIRTIKERDRSLFHNLPYCGIPKIIMKYLLMQTAATLNYFPARYGLSQYYNPRMILQQKHLNFETHYKHYTGEYVLAHDDKHITNNMESRALDCINLQPSSISKHVHEFYHISTKKIITRQFCTSIPTPAYVINIIEQQAQEDNMPIDITFKPKDKSCTHLRLAGVESDMDDKHQI